MSGILAATMSSSDSYRYRFMALSAIFTGIFKRMLPTGVMLMSSITLLLALFGIIIALMKTALSSSGGIICMGRLEPLDLYIVLNCSEKGRQGQAIC